MFDLNQAIEDWRRQMRSAGVTAPAPLDELEAHLRDDIEAHTQSGCDARQAFQCAVSRIGRADALEVEFAKSGVLAECRDRKRRIVGLTVCALIYALPLLWCASRILGQMEPGEGRLAMAAFALTILFLLSGFPAARFLPVVRERRARTRIQVLSAIPIVVWFGVFTFGIVPRLECDVGHLSMLTLWAFPPVGAAYAALALGLDEAARRGVSAA
jgi:hypothetical protein